MYDVVLLVERRLSPLDAAQVTGLHDGVQDTVAYHVVLPVADAAAQLHTSMGSVLGPELEAPSATVAGDDLAELQNDQRTAAEAALEASLQLLRSARHAADGEVTGQDPIRALASAVERVGAAEAIVLTEPHVVKELFHLDWTSRARRHLHVPTLHLLEHETFEEQAGGAGEGASLI